MFSVKTDPGNSTWTCWQCYVRTSSRVVQQDLTKHNRRIIKYIYEHRKFCLWCSRPRTRNVSAQIRAVFGHIQACPWQSIFLACRPHSGALIPNALGLVYIWCSIGQMEWIYYCKRSASMPLLQNEFEVRSCTRSGSLVSAHKLYGLLGGQILIMTLPLCCKGLPREALF